MTTNDRVYGQNHFQLKAMDAYMQLLSRRTPPKVFLLQQVDCC